MLFFVLDAATGTTLTYFHSNIGTTTFSIGSSGFIMDSSNHFQISRSARNQLVIKIRTDLMPGSGFYYTY